jgi:hypothetical protein
VTDEPSQPDAKPGFRRLPLQLIVDRYQRRSEHPDTATDAPLAEASSEEWEVARLRRSLTMLPPQACAGLSREEVLALLDKLRRLMEQAATE